MCVATLANQAAAASQNPSLIMLLTTRAAVCLDFVTRGSAGQADHGGAVAGTVGALDGAAEAFRVHLLAALDGALKQPAVRRSIGVAGAAY